VQGWKADIRVCTQGTNPNPQDFERYLIRFCGRKGFPGHAFIFLHRESAAFEKEEKNAYGFFPKKLNAGYLSIIVPVRGSMRTESTARYEYSFTLEITPEEYQSVLQIKEKWSENPRFFLCGTIVLRFQKRWHWFSKIALKYPIAGFLRAFRCATSEH
jgi:hypothetical protein